MHLGRQFEYKIVLDSELDSKLNYKILNWFVLHLVVHIS
jgi:hypothetical protein